MENWLLEALKQGGMFALAVFAIWMLNRVWADRLEAEKRNTEQIKQMWHDTKQALENNTRAVAAFMERYDSITRLPASRERKTLPRKVE